jgi:GMP synthase (glutamine-hydrolysing)
MRSAGASTTTRAAAIGTVAIERLPAAADDALLAAAPARFVAHASHQQSVLELPAGAVVLARSAHDPHHAVRYAPRAWGLQFHPEFSVESCAATCNGALAPPMAIARRPVARRAHTRPRRRPAGCCVASARSRWRAPERTPAPPPDYLRARPARRIAASGSPSLRPDR